MQLLHSFGQKQKYLRYIFNYFCRRSRIYVSKIILELTLIDNPIDLNCLYNKFPRRSRKLIRAEVVDIVVKVE